MDSCDAPVVGHLTVSRLAANGDTALMFWGTCSMVAPVAPVAPVASVAPGYGRSTILPWVCPCSSSRNASRTRSSG